MRRSIFPMAWCIVYAFLSTFGAKLLMYWGWVSECDACICFKFICPRSRERTRPCCALLFRLVVWVVFAVAVATPWLFRSDAAFYVGDYYSVLL